MTIQEFYDWVVQHGAVDYDLHTEEWWLLRDVDIRIDHESKDVYL